MKTVVLDSYALLVYFEKQPGWDEVAQLFTEAVEERQRLLLSVVNWGELCYITQRTYSEKELQHIIDLIDRLPIEVLDAGRGVTRRAASLKARGGLAYADCFAAGLAVEWEGTVLTGDPEFERVEDAVPVRWLPRRGEQ